MKRRQVWRPAPQEFIVRGRVGYSFAVNPCPNPSLPRASLPVPSGGCDAPIDGLPARRSTVPPARARRAQQPMVEGVRNPRRAELPWRRKYPRHGEPHQARAPAGPDGTSHGCPGKRPARPWQNYSRPHNTLRPGQLLSARVPAAARAAGPRICASGGSAGKG